MDENLKVDVVAIGYFNVIFYLFLKSDFDKVRFEYFQERVKNGEKLLMRDIYGWCNAKTMPFVLIPNDAIWKSIAYRFHLHWEK